MITGTRSVELLAPADTVYEVLADAQGFPAWQSTVREVHVREVGPDGRPLATRQRIDAKIRTVTVLLRYRYDAPRSLSWVAEKGSDIRAMDGAFLVEPTGETSCTVVYELAVDPGRTLGLLARGPVIDQVRDRVLDGTLSDLKRHVERR
ncbi:SRPBCC family protein [Paraconexibacter sp.]|uniref:SRPBCC family protein n=1 Tax=Paraconexibacter sp. TaxID=2949640 RepID=UPI00356670C8